MASTAYGARQIVAEIYRRAAMQRDALAIEIVRQLQQPPPLGTPVLTGWARANWIASLDAPNETAASQGSPAGALARSQASLVQLLAFGPNRPFAKAHVFNPVPYVNRLNSVAFTRDGVEGGHSAQSAPGWIERSVERAVRARQEILASAASDTI